MINNLIQKSYSDIFEKLYEITKGSVILGGSLSLCYRKIIERNPNDLDVTITLDDWHLYKRIIEKSFRIIPNVKMKYDMFEYEVYTCFELKNKVNEFHLFVNYDSNIFDVIDKIRILSPSYLLRVKELILKENDLYENGKFSEKHLSDIESIKRYLNGK